MLLDTCVLSELVRPRPDARVLSWLEGVGDAELFLSVLTLGEIAKGKERLPQGPKRRRLEEWLEEVQREFADRILPIDAAVARTWGRVSARAEAKGRPASVVDGLIASTALSRDVPVATRNVEDFSAFGVTVVDPWRGASS